MAEDMLFAPSNCFIFLSSYIFQALSNSARRGLSIIDVFEVLTTATKTGPEEGFFSAKKLNSRIYADSL